MFAIALPPAAPTFEELRIDNQSKREIVESCVVQTLQSMLDAKQATIDGQQAVRKRGS
jgi:hypothetical protein